MNCIHVFQSKFNMMFLQVMNCLMHNFTHIAGCKNHHKSEALTKTTMLEEEIVTKHAKIDFDDADFFPLKRKEESISLLFCDQLMSKSLKASLAHSEQVITSFQTAQGTPRCQRWVPFFKLQHRENEDIHTVKLFHYNPSLCRPQRSLY